MKKYLLNIISHIRFLLNPNINYRTKVQTYVKSDLITWKELFFLLLIIIINKLNIKN
jgi:hypothetical protein